MITIGLITSRLEPRLDWFFDSLRRQEGVEVVKQIVVVDNLAQEGDGWGERDVGNHFGAHSIMADNGILKMGISVRFIPPKPTVWAGPHRLTKQDWWHASNARNTWLCEATQPWCVGLDDRCVLEPGWLAAVLEAVKGNYAVFGSYEKRHGLVVEDGVITDPGVTNAVDHRETECRKRGIVMPFRMPPEWSYGCTFALPTAWALEVNGFDETCDGASAEDSIFGMYLKNCGKALKYDYRMKVIQDRTPGQTGPAMIRRDKGVSPNDKSHAQLAMLRPLKRSMHQWDLNTVRADRLAGKPWPIPTGPTHDWYDGQPLSEMTPT